MKASKTPGSTEYYVNIDEFNLEHHVEEVFGYAYLNFPNQIIDAATFIKIIITYVRTRKISSDAFKKLSDLLISVKQYEALKEPVSFKLKSTLVTKALQESFLSASSTIKKTKVWGRDLITIVLLSEDESLNYLAKEAGTDLKKLQEDWYRYLTDRKTKKHRDWNEWWKLTGINIPNSQNSLVNEETNYFLYSIPSASLVNKEDYLKKIIEKEIENLYSELKENDTIFIRSTDKGEKSIVAFGFFVKKDSENSALRLKGDSGELGISWQYYGTNPLVKESDLSIQLTEDSIWHEKEDVLKIPIEFGAKLLLICKEKLNEISENKDSSAQLIFTADHGGVAPILADNIRSGATDHLNVENEAQAFARVAASRMIRPPLAIGIFGEWGSGKTFFMEKIREHIEELQVAANSVKESAYHKKIVQIRFNAWHYMESNLWASLVDHIFKEMDKWLIREQKTNNQIDELYEQLATARMLQLESIMELVASRKRLKEADERLLTARIKLDKTEAARESLTLKNYWNAVGRLFVDKKIEQEKIQKAAQDLGLLELNDSAKGLQEALESVKDQAKQGKLLYRSLVNKFKNPLWLIPLIVILVGLPFGIRFILSKLYENVSDIYTLVIAISTTLAGITGWVGRVLNLGSKSINILNNFNNNLNLELEKKKEQSEKEDKDVMEILRYKQIYEHQVNEVALAEEHFQKVSAESELARSDLNEQKASSRLNRFIRNKITEGNYAKHLGIIASIRKDFEELTAIMMDLDKDQDIMQEVKNQRNEFYDRVDSILADKSIHEDKDIVEKLLKLREPIAPSDESKMEFFQRIVLYIDDLDRCPPQKVIEVLQACHLLLYFPLFVVVVAVDARWVSHALVEEYKGLLGSDNTDENSASPRDYLEKIFQIPYWVRRMHGDATKKYAVELIGTVEELSSQMDSEEIKERVSPEPEPEKVEVDGTIVSQNDLKGDSVPEEPVKELDENVSAVKENTSENELSIKVINIDPNPESLKISSYERDFIELLSPFAGDSPRTIKRFINVYKLLRAGLSSETLNRLVGTNGESQIYRAIIAQLAIVTGAPVLADTYFELLGPIESTIPEKPSILLDLLCKKQKVINSKEQKSVIGPLKELVEVGNSLEMIQEMRIRASLVKRYSFSARPFLY